MNRMQPIDQSKVNAFLASWNTGRPANSPLWIEIIGTNSLMEMTINPNGAPVTFQPNMGFPIKAFKNVETGEVRIFDARRFT